LTTLKTNLTDPENAEKISTILAKVISCAHEKYDRGIFSACFVFYFLVLCGQILPTFWFCFDVIFAQSWVMRKNVTV
jgi:hypothetical protein